MLGGALGGVLGGVGAGVVGCVIAAIVGVALDNTIGRSLQERPRSLEYDVSELPASLTSDPEWPVDRQTGRVLVVPRQIVTRVVYPWWNALTIRTGDQKFVIRTSFYLRRQVVQCLRDYGWSL